MQSRFRLFAGPNGSGKTQLFTVLREQSYIHTELFINADSIERRLNESMRFNFNAYHIKVSSSEFRDHVKESGLLTKSGIANNINSLEISSGVLKIKIEKQELNSYIASFIATFLVKKLLHTGQSFCYETVLSHPSKIEFLKQARKNGYKTYLYFIFTDNWRLNVERVKLRVKQGGHNVDENKIKSRYFKSLKLFHEASINSDITYLIDNSKDFNCVAELRKGKNYKSISNYPDWLRAYYEPKKGK
jgi:predicted ABC-type ATPase